MIPMVAAFTDGLNSLLKGEVLRVKPGLNVIPHHVKGIQKSTYTTSPLRESDDKDNTACPAGKKRNPAEYCSSSPTNSLEFVHAQAESKIII